MPTPATISAEIGKLRQQLEAKQPIAGALKDASDQLSIMDTTGLSQDAFESLRSKLLGLTRMAEHSDGSQSATEALSLALAATGELAAHIQPDSPTSAGQIAGEADHGYSVAYKNLPEAQAMGFGLPANVAALQSPSHPGGAQQVNSVQNGRGDQFFMTSGNGADADKYQIFDGVGALVGSMQAPAALGLDDGESWLMLTADGVADSGSYPDVEYLEPGTKLFDLNGLKDNGNKVVERGVAAGTKGFFGGPKPAASTFAYGDGGKVGAQQSPTRFDNKDLLHSWVGVDGGNGRVYADTYVGSGPYDDTNVRFKDVSGNEFTVPELQRGEFGRYQFQNGAAFVSNTEGLWMVAGDKATNIVTGDVVDEKQVTDSVMKLWKDGKAVSLHQNPA